MIREDQSGILTARAANHLVVGQPVVDVGVREAEESRHVGLHSARFRAWGEAANRRAGVSRILLRVFHVNTSRGHDALVENGTVAQDMRRNS